MQAANRKLRLRDKSKSANLDSELSSTAAKSQSHFYQNFHNSLVVAKDFDRVPVTPTTDAERVGADMDVVYDIKRYPAYRFQRRQFVTMSSTENAKPCMTRVFASCESLYSRAVVNSGGGTNYFTVDRPTPRSAKNRCKLPREMAFHNTTLNASQPLLVSSSLTSADNSMVSRP